MRGAIIDDLDIDLDLEPTGITNPLTGLPVDVDNVDELVDCFEHVKNVADECYATKRRVAERLAKLTSGDKKTRRIEGERRRAKVEMPSTAWDQKLLRSAWDEFPGVAERCLKIATIGVQAVEYKKLLETTGGIVLMDFIKAVQLADKGPQGTPTITVET